MQESYSWFLQAWDVDTVLGQCWLTVFNCKYSPAIIQHRVSVYYFLVADNGTCRVKKKVREKLGMSISHTPTTPYTTSFNMYSKENNTIVVSASATGHPRVSQPLSQRYVLKTWNQLFCRERNKKTASVYFTSEQILPFGFEEKYCLLDVISLTLYPPNYSIWIFTHLKLWIASLQASENYSDFAKWRSTDFKYCWLMSHFIFVICLKCGS